jgi:hypothetical protein
MNQISIVCIGFSGLCLVVGAVLFFLSRRNSNSGTRSNSERDRAVIDDRDDRIIWEIGQGFPLVDKDAEAKVMPRRAFFSRAALGILGTFVSWRMARGATNTFLLSKIGGRDTSETGSLPRGLGANQSGTSSAAQNELAFMEGQDHQDLHYDSHTDIDAHNDNMISHQDSYIRGTHYDVPHVDWVNHGDSGHNDTHTDTDS